MKADKGKKETEGRQPKQKGICRPTKRMRRQMKDKGNNHTNEGQQRKSKGKLTPTKELSRQMKASKGVKKNEG